MIAGRQKYRLTLMRPVSVTDRYGAETVTWEDVLTVPAERVRNVGRRSDEAGEHFPDYSVSWNVRAVYEVDENWRVRQTGGHLYQVLAIEENRARGYNTLITERVNE